MAEKTIFDLLREENTMEQLSQLATYNLAEINEEGQTPLHLAVLNNNIEVAALLLQKGFNPNQKDNNQLSPLIASAANGFDEMFQLLLMYNPDLKQVNRFGGTSLLPSSEKGFIKVVQQALDAGVPVNHQNRLGWTALLEAVVLGNEGYLFRDITEELVNHGADVTIKDFDDFSAVDYAKKRNSQLILPILENRAQDTSFTEVKNLIRDKKFFNAIKQLLEMEETAEQLYYLGFTYESLKNEKAASHYYKRGYKLDNQFAYYLGNLAKKVGNSQQAISFFEEGGRVRTDSVFYNYHLSNYLRELGRHEEAIEIMDTLLEEDPKRVDYLFHKANSLRSLARHKEAYETMLLASEIQPTNLLFCEHAKESQLKIKKGGE